MQSSSKKSSVNETRKIRSRTPLTRNRSGSPALDLARATLPRLMRLEARFNVRGGIYTTVIAEHRKKGWQGTMPEN